MRPTLRIFLSAASSLLVAVIPVAPPAAAADAPQIATGEVAGTILTVSPGIAFDSATLRVAGPGGYEAITWSEGEPLTLDLLTAGVIPASDGMPGGTPQILPDGRYGYEVVFYMAEGERRVHDGRFFVENGGVIESRPGVDGPRSAPSGGLVAEEEHQGPENVNAAATVADDSLQVLDTNNDDYTFIALQNTDWDAGPTDDYSIVNDGGDLLIGGISGAGPVAPYRFSIRNNGNVGIGTTVPQADLHIYRPGGNIRITDSDSCPNANAAWEIEEDFGRLKFEVVPNCPGDLVGGKMWIHGTGNIGIGTNEPANSLHISRPYPAIRITDSDPCPNPSASWLIDQVSESLRFGVVTKCSGDPAGTKMVIHGSGNVGIGTASPAAKLHVIGGGIIEGDVALGSSRTIKHGIEPVDTSDVLASIRDLPLYRWKYKDDPVQAAHVGPMAEDVHAAFRLGLDEKHLSPADSAGLALAAIQGVDREVTDLRAVVEALAARNGALASENQSLRERLETIEDRLGDVPGVE